MHPSSDTALLLRETFENHPITFVTFRGDPVVVARELGAALGYADPSKIGEKIRGDWSGDFIEGTDYRLLDGADLAAFKAEWPDTPESGASTLDRTRRALLVLTESGWWMVAQKTEKALGVKLRRFLVEVLKKIARGEAIGGAVEPSALPRTPMEVTAYDRETRLYAGAMMRSGRKSDAADYMRSREQARGLFLSGPTTPTAPPPAQTQLPFAPPAEAAPAASPAVPKVDRSGDDWDGFVAAWSRKYGVSTQEDETVVSAADLLTLAAPFIEVIGGPRVGRPARFGKMLMARLDRVYGGLRIVHRNSTIRGYALYKAPRK